MASTANRVAMICSRPALTRARRSSENHSTAAPGDPIENPSCRGLEGRRPAQHRDRRPRRPARRRGAGRSEGDRHLPHRLLHLVRRRSGRPVPGDPRPRGRRHRARGRRGREQRARRRPRDPALHAGVPAVQVLPVEKDQPLPADPLDPGPRPDAGRDQPLQPERQAALALHGHVDVQQLHRRAGDRAREGAHGRAVRDDLLHRLRRDDRRRRGHLHGQGRSRCERRRVRTRRHRPQRDPGRQAGRRRQDHRHRREPGARGDGAQVRHDALHQRRRRRRTSSMPSCS